MRFLAKISLLGVLGMMAVFGSPNLFVSQAAQPACPTDANGLALALLPSLGDEFVILTRDQFQSDKGDIFATSPGPAFDFRIVPNSPNFPEEFVIWLDPSPLEDPNEPNPEAFIGTLLVDRPFDSLAALTITQDEIVTLGAEDDLIEGQMKGFFVVDLTQELAVSLPSDNWFFVEPLKPLLRNVYNRSSSPCSGLDGASFEAILDGLPRSVHVLYEFRRLDFDLVMGIQPPVSQLATPQSEENGSRVAPSQTVSRAVAPATCRGNSCLDVALRAVVDRDFMNTAGVHDLRRPAINRVARRDVLTLFNMVVSREDTSVGRLPTFFSREGVEVDLDIVRGSIRNLEIAEFNAISDPYHDETSNAYEVMCGFITAEPGHSHSAANSYEIVHLLSGTEFGTFPKRELELISDSGDDFCPMAGCGTGKLVGLAQGVGDVSDDGRVPVPGGFTTDGLPLKDGQCSQSPDTNPSDELAASFYQAFEPGHHSLSQQRPNSDQDDEGGTRQYDALLAQRWVIVAHEIGHNLCAKHSRSMSEDSRSIMNSVIDQETSYSLPQENVDQINACIEYKRGPSTR